MYMLVSYLCVGGVSILEAVFASVCLSLSANSGLPWPRFNASKCSPSGPNLSCPWFLHPNLSNQACFPMSAKATTRASAKASWLRGVGVTRALPSSFHDSCSINSSSNNYYINSSNNSYYINSSNNSYSINSGCLTGAPALQERQQHQQHLVVHVDHHNKSY